VDVTDPVVELRRLGRTDLWRVAEIDRREHIDVLYDQHGTRLVPRHGDWDAAAWDPDGVGDHSVSAQRRALEHAVDAGGSAFGAFAGAPLVGIGVVVPHLRPGIAQLAFLHVSARWRASGIGCRLSEQLDHVARTAGDVEMVVSATPSGNTVRFYRGRGFRPMAEPLAELFDAEPDDVHMHKALGPPGRHR
jgi:ribosomal protein S18 acetylase RimI-like enzyme